MAAFTPVELTDGTRVEIARTAGEASDLLWRGWWFSGGLVPPQRDYVVEEIENAPDVHPLGHWDFEFTPTVQGSPLGSGGGSGGTVADATTTIKGIVELATNAEAVTGTDVGRAVTPSGVKAAIAAAAPGSAPDSTSTTKGLVQLAGDLAGTASAPTVPGLGNKVDVSTYNTGVTNARARANHTGTQSATTITGLAPVATSGAYADLSGKPVPLVVIGSPSSPLTDANTARTAGAVVAYWCMAAGVTPVNAINGDLIWNA